MPGDTPATGVRNPLRPATSTSLLPIHTDANVGCARSAACTWLRPRRISPVSVFDATVPAGDVGSSTRAPGTATLVSTSLVSVLKVRPEQASGVVPVGTPVVTSAP